MKHVFALAAFVVLMSVVSARQNGSGQPAWYARTIGAIGVPGALAGGWLATAL